MKRSVFFVAAVVMLLMYAPVRDYLYWTCKSPYYTHIVLIPLISVFFVIKKRNQIFAAVESAFFPGLPIVSLGLLLLVPAVTIGTGWVTNDKYALVAFSIVSVIIGTFILLFGKRAFQAARFPLAFLMFMIPLPTGIEYWVLRALQFGSAEFAGLLFPLTGVPVLRDGVIFQLPGITIEVAPQCSGIRSSLALLITAVLAGHLFLQSTWKKIILVLAVIPVTMFKNGIRIVTLSLLGVYVDRGYLESSLHRDGGVVFFVMALLIMGPMLILFRKGEAKRGMRSMDKRA
jgi:exosortase